MREVGERETRLDWAMTDPFMAPALLILNYFGTPLSTYVTLLYV